MKKAKSFFFGELFAAVCSAFCRYGIRFIFIMSNNCRFFLSLGLVLRKHADNLAGWLAGWVVSFAILSSSFGWCVGFDRFVFGDRCADATDLPANDIACLLLFTGSLPDSGFAPFACRCELPVAGDGCLLLHAWGFCTLCAYCRTVETGIGGLAVDGCFVCIGRAGGNLVRCRSRGPGDVVAGEGMARMSGTSVRDCPDALVVLSFLLAAGIPNDRFAGFLL